MRTVRVGTILWGAILLVFAAIAFSVAVFDLRLIEAISVTWIVTGLGVVFVLAAIIALISRAVSSTADEPEPSYVAAEPEPTAKAPTTAEPKGQPVD